MSLNKKIAIVGAGTSGYFSVLYFCTKYPNYDIHWIYPENNNPIGVGEGTVPQVTEFLNDLGITFKDIIKTVDGSLKLGIKFENFVPETFYHAFGIDEDEAAKIEYFMEHNIVPENIEDYDISFHFNVANLAKFFDTWFERFNNLTIERRTVTSTDEVNCDWFIDCTGFKRAFVNEHYSDNFMPIDNFVPNNKALVYRTSIPEHKRSIYTTCIGMKHGWVWNIPLREQIGIGYVHDSAYNVKDEFLDYLEQEGFGRPEVREVNMVTGRNKNHYKKLIDKHIVSVGLSSSFIEPLEATGLYLTVFSIEQLDKLMHEQISSEEYNNLVNFEFDVIVDFIAAHYKFSHNSNEYWDFYKTLPIELYRLNHAFPNRSWDCILRKDSKKITKEQIKELNNTKPYVEWLKDKGYITV